MTSETFTNLLIWGAGPTGWLAQTLDGVCRIPQSLLEEYFPSLSPESAGP